MKHLHYGSIVIAISDQLASTFQTAAHDFMAAGRSAVWPVSGYRDDRDEISIQLAVGPGIAFAITDTWLPDAREPSRHDADSIAYIDGEHEALEKEQLSEAVRNVLVYGRFDRRSTNDAGSWRFSGHPAVMDGGAPGDSAWSNFYIVGRYVDTPL